MGTAVAADQIPTLLRYLTPAERAELDGLLGMHAPRDLHQRRRYAGDPWAYIHDVLGWALTPQQEEILDVVEHHDRVIIASANNLGKDFIVSAWALYRYDAVAAVADDERGLTEQGCQLLLPAPDANTAFSTFYSALLEHRLRAIARGYPMPGRWSERSVLAQVRPRWFIEAFSPPKDARQDIAHSASGRHHRNQVAIITEAQGVEERLFRATEGMCSGEGNTIVCLLNPSLAAGPAFQRERSGAYRTLHLSAFEHPNVQARRISIPEAVAYRTIDARVRNECRDRGAYPDVQPDPEQQDFLYALPQDEEAESQPRTDGIPGDGAGVVHVYRPTGTFAAQVLGVWPAATNTGLFDPGTLDAAMARWRNRPRPTSAPDRVGFDVAPGHEGGDENVIVPSWGENAEALLRAYATLRTGPPQQLQDLLAFRRIYVGEPCVLQKGDGHAVAHQAQQRFPASPWNVDEGGGWSVIDYARNMLRRSDTAAISFAAAAPEPVPGEPWCENLRTSMYVRAALLVTRGLIDLPDDPLLREELLAHHVIQKTRVVEKHDPLRGRLKERVDSVLLCPKEEIKKHIGRSPDRADAFVLSLVEYVYRSTITVRRLVL